MNRAFPIVPAALAALAGFPAAAAPVDAGDLQALRAEIAQMKQTYEQRIAALENRLKQAEGAVAQAQAVPAQPARREGGKADAFNPEIGLILQGRATKMQDVAERTVTGYWPAGHAHDGDTRGLSLEHTELVFAANIDPSFRGVARFAVAGDGSVEVEEASVSTLGLGQGFDLRGGRFRSEIGYQNAQHPHQWDFADASLMQRVLFGAEGYRHDGLQVKWVAPTELFLQLGAEIGRGAGFPGSDRNKNGSGAGALFAKFGDDVGAAHSWQAGLSFLQTRAVGREAHFADVAANEVQGLFSGKSRTAIADFVWKWAPNGNPKERNFKFQTEVFRRSESGDFSCNDAAGVSASCAGTALGNLAARQSGGYAQAVYQFMPRWRLGYRHDWLGKGSKSFDAAAVFAALDANNAYFADYKPRRDSLMVDWSNSEYSRLRLQYAQDRSQQGLTDNQWTLQYIMSLGAHGAHKF